MSSTLIQQQQLQTRCASARYVAGPLCKRLLRFDSCYGPIWVSRRHRATCGWMPGTAALAAFADDDDAMRCDYVVGGEPGCSRQAQADHRCGLLRQTDKDRPGRLANRSLASAEGNSSL